MIGILIGIFTLIIVITMSLWISLVVKLARKYNLSFGWEMILSYLYIPFILIVGGIIYELFKT